MTVQMIPTMINDRWELLLPEHRAVRPQWALAAGGWEVAHLESMHANLRPDDVVYDVGAEEGDLPALWASWGCDVVLIEPNVRVWPNMKVIWEANELRRPLGCFVGFAADRETETTWHMGTGWWSSIWPECADGAVIGDHSFLHLSQHEGLHPQITLDTVARLTKPPNAITIDVEGSELRVLHGAHEVLRRHRPLVWVSAHTDRVWMDENYNSVDAKDLCALMDGFDYRSKLLEVTHEEFWFHWPRERTVIL